MQPTNWTTAGEGIHNSERFRIDRKADFRALYRTYVCLQRAYDPSTGCLIISPGDYNLFDRVAKHLFHTVHNVYI